jgi:pimaricinolide synthase PimS1
MTTPQALQLFDTAINTTHPTTIATHLDTTALRHQAESGVLAPVLRGLVRTTAASSASLSRKGASGAGTGAAGEATFMQGLLGLTAEQQEERLLEFVREQAAAVLGHGSVDAIDARRGFMDMGFDSLTAIELRNRLTRLTGLQLPTTLLFDYPAPNTLAQQLVLEFIGAGQSAAAPLLAQLDRLEADSATLLTQDEDRARVADRLRALLSRLNGGATAPTNDNGTPAPTDVTASIDEAATDDEIFDFIDNQLGISRADTTRRTSQLPVED